MNLRILTIRAMVSVSGGWLEDADVRGVLEVHILGRALLYQLQAAHDLVAALDQRKIGIEAELSRLGRIITSLDGTHDRFVRATYHHLNGLIEAAEDPALRDWLIGLRDQFFPDDLALVKASYVDESGWARVVSTKLTSEARARMSGIVLGTHTLDELCQSWLTAGIDLGNSLHERAKTEALTAGTGPDAEELHASRVRSLWIRTVQAFVGGLDLMRISAADRAMILAPLNEAIASAVRSAQKAGAGTDDDVDDDVDADVDDDVDADADADVDADVDAGADADADAGVDAAPAPSVEPGE